MSGEFVISSVLSQHNENLKRQTSVTPLRRTSVTAQFYLSSKGTYILEAREHADPKDVKRREALQSNFDPFFTCFFPHPPEPAPCKLGYPGGLFVLPEVLTLVLGPSFVLFSQAFPFLVFLPSPFWTSFSYSNYLTFSYSLNLCRRFFEVLTAQTSYVC